MAGSIVVTASDLGGGYTKYAVAWTSDGAGAVSANTFAAKRGHVHEIRYVPGSGGTQPTNLYSMTMPDADSFDVLTGTGASLSNVNSKTSVPLVGDGTTTSQRFFHVGGNLTPTVSAAGAAKTGTVNLIVGP